MDKSKESRSKLVKTGSNTPEVFELIEEAFNQMAFLVLNPITIPRIGFINLGWNTKIGIVVSNVLTEVVLSISLVRHDDRSLQSDVIEDIFGND